MKSLLFIFFLFSNTLFAAWDCKTTEGTLSIISTEGCSQIKYCVGYAICKTVKGDVSGRIICKAKSNSTCPDANSCLNEAYAGENIQIAIQPNNDSKALYKFCSSSKSLSPLRTNGVDVANAYFCNTISGDYRKTKYEPMPTMTGKEGGGGQMTTAR